MPPKTAEAPARSPKHYILDTNVLIHDPGSPFQFKDNVVWLPVEVFEELDRFKSESSTRGANAREVQAPPGFLGGRKIPTGRYTFCTHDPFKADSPLLPSGLLGPVTISTTK